MRDEPAGLHESSLALPGGGRLSGMSRTAKPYAAGATSRPNRPPTLRGADAAGAATLRDILPTSPGPGAAGAPRSAASRIVEAPRMAKMV